MCSVIALDKVDLVCVETVKDKPTGNDSGFITYSITICFLGIQLDNIGYLITQWEKTIKRLFHGSKIGENKNIPQGG